MVAPSSPTSASLAPPGRRTLRGHLFWAARWLLGGPHYHGGRLRVVIDEGDDTGEMLVMRPRSDDDTGHQSPPQTGGETDLTPLLLAALLSTDGMTLMKLIAARGPVAAKVIAAGVTIERSKCYVLLTDLRDRGLIADHGDGYEVVACAVWAAVSAEPG